MRLQLGLHASERMTRRHISCLCLRAVSVTQRRKRSEKPVDQLVEDVVLKSLIHHTHSPGRRHLTPLSAKSHLISSLYRLIINFGSLFAVGDAASRQNVSA